MSYLRVKRWVDIALATLGLLAFLPLMAVLACMIWFSMGGGVLFRQPRPGLQGQIFYIYKFRTMVPPDPAAIRSDEERITPLGRWLRATSLDELPELFNVIRGEMSLVGPRPLLVEYLDRYTPAQMRRHDVLPGITGLAQVRGRNELRWGHKFRYDVFYVDRVGFLLDAWILYQTVGAVLLRKGFRSHGEPTRLGEN